MDQHSGSALSLYIPGISKVTQQQIDDARLTVCEADRSIQELRELLEALGLITPHESGLLDD